MVSEYKCQLIQLALASPLEFVQQRPIQYHILASSQWPQLTYYCVITAFPNHFVYCLPVPNTPPLKPPTDGPVPSRPREKLGYLNEDESGVKPRECSC